MRKEHIGENGSVEEAAVAVGCECPDRIGCGACEVIKDRVVGQKSLAYGPIVPFTVALPAVPVRLWVHWVHSLPAIASETEQVFQAVGAHGEGLGDSITGAD